MQRSCNGYADVDASAECKASAEVRATTHTTCTPAKTEIVQQDVTVVDATKWNKAMAAINAGLPDLLTASKKLEMTAKAVVLWVQTGASLVKASGQLVGEIGERGVCVGGQLAGVVAAAANIQARIDVSIEVSASVSASAGAPRASAEGAAKSVVLDGHTIACSSTDRVVSPMSASRKVTSSTTTAMSRA